MTRKTSDGLRQLPVFASLPRRALTTAGSLLTPVSFDAGNVLCEEGHIGREAFVIVSGSAIVTKGAEEIATVGPGDVVGELALLGDGWRTATVTATEPITAYAMSPQEFTSILELPGVAEAIQKTAD